MNEEPTNMNSNNTDIIDDAPDTTLNAHENAAQTVVATNVIEEDNTIPEELTDDNEVVDPSFENSPA